MSQPVAVITGASSCIGLAVTKHLVTQGWRVVMADIDEESGQKPSTELGNQVFSWEGDRLDLYAANAGIAGTQFLHGNDYHYDGDDMPLPLNLKTMDVPGGKVIITSSSAGLYRMATNPIYTASKMAGEESASFFEEAYKTPVS